MFGVHFCHPFKRNVFEADNFGNFTSPFTESHF